MNFVLISHLSLVNLSDIAIVAGCESIFQNARNMEQEMDKNHENKQFYVNQADLENKLPQFNINICKIIL